jgi:hypothetical protein
MDKLESQKIAQIVEENAHLKNKIAFSIGALEGISYLLKNNDPSLTEQNLEHLKEIVNRVVDDLKRETFLSVD